MSLFRLFGWYELQEYPPEPICTRSIPLLVSNPIATCALTEMAVGQNRDTLVDHLANEQNRLPGAPGFDLPPSNPDGSLLARAHSRSPDHFGPRR